MLETGHDSRHDGEPAAGAVDDGFCAWPPCSVPDAAAAVTAVLAAHLDLVDRSWTVVLEDSAKSMITAEVPVGSSVPDGRVVAANCVLTATPWTDVTAVCAEVVV